MADLGFLGGVAGADSYSDHPPMGELKLPEGVWNGET